MPMVFLGGGHPEELSDADVCVCIRQSAYVDDLGGWNKPRLHALGGNSFCLLPCHVKISCQRIA